MCIRDRNVCDGQVFVGKTMQYNLGVLAARHGLGGVFPWALSYDSFAHNNTLVRYLDKGFS